MAKSVKLDRLLKDLAEDIDSVVSVLTAEQIKSLSECRCETFKLAGLVLSTYVETELDTDQEKDLKAAEKELSDLNASQEKAANKIRVKFYEILKGKMEKAKPADYGKILVQNESDQAAELAESADSFVSTRDYLREKIKQLSNVKIIAAENAVKDLYGYSGSSGANGIKPDIAGNSWLVLDLCTRTEGVSAVRGQWYCDDKCTLWFLPVGSDWHKSIARPFTLPTYDGWNEIVTLPADKLTSASYLQALAHALQKTIKERESVEDLAAYATNIVTKGEVDMSSTGGSRSVWHVVAERQDPGYARQIYGDNLAKYNLPTVEEPTE